MLENMLQDKKQSNKYIGNGNVWQCSWLGVEEMHLSVRPHWVKGDRLRAPPSRLAKRKRNSGLNTV